MGTTILADAGRMLVIEMPAAVADFLLLSV
jgi:hypothetical protein